VADSAPAKQSFWTTLPGFLAAVAGLITAAVGAYGAITRATVTTPPPYTPASAPPVVPDPCAPEHGDDRPMSCFEKNK